ncbi:hypothetical protein YC2023_083853 [Brassica napus]
MLIELIMPNKKKTLESTPCLHNSSIACTSIKAPKVWKKLAWGLRDPFPPAV